MLANQPCCIHCSHGGFPDTHTRPCDRCALAPTSEWEPLYRAEKARADAAEAALRVAEKARDMALSQWRAQDITAAEAAVARVRELAERWGRYDDRAIADAESIRRALGDAP